MSEFINATIELMTALAGNGKSIEPTRKIVNYLGLQDPPTKVYKPHEIEEQKLTCIGANRENGLAEYLTLPDIFTHTLAVGKTGIGKTTYFMSTYLFRFIYCYRDASVVILDAMDGVIEEVIALCKKINRPYRVLPDDGMNMLNCGGNSHTIADKLGQIYIQNQGSMAGDGAFFHKVVKDYFLYSIPVFYR